MKARTRRIAADHDIMAVTDIAAATDDALVAIVTSAGIRRTIAVGVARAVVAVRAAHGDYILTLLATDVPTSQRGELVHHLSADLDVNVFPGVIEVAVKAAAVAVALAEVPAPTSSAKAAGVGTSSAISALGLTKIEGGKYRHASGAVIERRAPGRIGRGGFAYAGWAIVVDGRETSRWSTLARAAEQETDRVESEGIR